MFKKTSYIFHVFFNLVLEIDKNAFKLYRQEQVTTQKNHIKLRFKTIYATGLLVFAQGANKKDFLSLELYRGKVR